MKKYFIHKIEVWNLPFHKDQGFQKINDRNWAIDIIEKTDDNHCDSLTIGGLLLSERELYIQFEYWKVFPSWKFCMLKQIMITPTP